MSVDTRSESGNHLIISYLTLRQSIGYTGALLPFALGALARWIFGTPLQSSLSAYYHTDVRSVFVGTLCVLGAFLLSYKGYEARPRIHCRSWWDTVRRIVTDNVAANVAGVCAIGLAMFPTAPASTGVGVGPVLSDTVKLVSAVHLGFTVVFFLALVYMSAALFTMTEFDTKARGRKVDRNRVYKTCAAVMALCLVLIVVVKFRKMDSLLGLSNPVFYLESGAVVAFGVSWLVKGRTLGILQDRNARGRATGK